MSIKEMMQENVNTNSSPSELKITDIRFADIEGGPFENSLIKIETNQGITGFGEVRDFGCKQYALMLKSRLLHENPCDVDRLFHRIKQFGHHGRQGGGVSGIELALWDIVGKVYSVPVYQLIGGKYRDKIDVYCDTDVYGKHDGKAMGEALKKRMEKGFKLLKMDVGIDLLLDEPGMLCGPKWILDAMRRDADMPKFTRSDGSVEGDLREKAIYDLYNIEHPFTGIQITEKGLDYLEQYVADARSVVGYEIPISIDHFGHVGVNDCIKLLRRLEKYNIAWAEDLLPWQYLGQYRKIASATAVPLCTGEDTYGKEAFREIIQSGAFSVVHPDILTSGGILETKKISEIAEEHGVAMAIHNAESPIAFLAAVHVAAASRSFLALEHHSNDIPWWGDLVMGCKKPIIENGQAELPTGPGLGIQDLNDEVIREHMHSSVKGMWEDTGEWDRLWSHDRLWS